MAPGFIGILLNLEVILAIGFRLFGVPKTSKYVINGPYI